jgi:magnesium-protoporphyrin IX monomethyl ester (oxidative) cyclase
VRVLDLTVEGIGLRRISARGDLYLYGLSPEQFRSRIESERPDLVAISCLFSGQIVDILNICRQVKQVSPDIFTLLGGTHPTFMAREIMQNHREVDFILLGESDASFPLLIRALNGEGDLSRIDGIAFRGNGNEVVNPKTHYIENLDEIPFPALDLLPMETYYRIHKPISSIVLGSLPESRRFAPMITSRGCPFRCRFCSSTRYWGYRYRYRSAANILEEIEERVERYGIGEIQFLDDNLTVNRARALELFRGMIDRKLPIRWCMPNGVQVSTLDDELLELMRRSGCYEMNLAIESGCQDVLDRIIQKPLKLSSVDGVVRKAKSIGIRLNAFFMIGLPGETPAQIRKTLEYARRSDVDFPILFKTNPLVGSEVHRICVEKGYISRNYELQDNDFFKARFDSDQFDRKTIDRLAARHYFWVYRRMLLRNPRRFFRVFLPIMVKMPVRFLSFAIRKLARTL